MATLGGNMRWYVSRAGETQGPLDEADVRARAKRDLLRGAQVRDEAGGAWVAAEKSPFASLMKERGWTAPIVAGIVVGALGAIGGQGLLYGLLPGLLVFGALALYRRF